MQKVELVYLAGPIDFDTSKDKKVWRDIAAKRLKDKGICTFSPLNAFSWKPGMKAQQKIIDINERALLESDVILMCLPKDVPTIGSVVELVLAERSGVPIVLLSDIDTEKSVYLHHLTPYSDIVEAIEVIVDMNV
jgi:nucleoside 2-deoxyribosyltransferase